MYKDLFDENHKMFSFNPYQRVRGEGFIKRPSSGEWEGGLLCSDCDNRLLGGYESYASKAIYGGKLQEDESPVCNNYINKEGVQFSTCTNISYAKMKIFLLSILWRASISSRPLFSEISLGAHEEIIRKMIYDEAPGNINDYPIIIMTSIKDKSMPKDIIFHPSKLRMEGGSRVYNFMIGAIYYLFYVNSKSHSLPEFVLNQTLNPKNELNIIHMPEGVSIQILRSYLGLSK